MTRTEIIELLNEMYGCMTHIADDLTKDPCAVQKDVNELYGLAQFLPYDCEADDEDDEDEDWDEDDDEFDDDQLEEFYQYGRADGYEEGYEAGYIEGLRRGNKS